MLAYSYFELRSKVLTLERKNKKRAFYFVLCSLIRTFAINMTQKYALFFDIDGTLVSFKTHEIPASTIFALTQAKANGSRVYIATGRPPLIITNLGAIEHLIDG